MRNLQNNKRYNIINNLNLVILICTVLSAVLRVVIPGIVKRKSIFSAYVAWYTFNADFTRYQSNASTNPLRNIIATFVLLMLPYLICWLLAKKRIAFMISSAVIFLIDTFLFALDVLFVYEKAAYLTFGLVYKIIVFIIMLVGIYYGIIGRRIEIEEDDDLVSDVKFLSNEYDSDLASQERKITLNMEGSRFNNYIYLQCYIDDNHFCYLKSGDSTSFVVDGNPHKITIVAHFASIRPMLIEIKSGERNKTYTLSIKRKYLFFKSINIA